MRALLTACIFGAALLIGAPSTTALADPVELSDSELDGVTAGAFDTLFLTIYAPVNVFVRNDGTTAAGATKINISQVFPFTFVNNETQAGAFGVGGGAGSLAGTFGILSPQVSSTALSQALGFNLTRVFQQ